MAPQLSVVIATHNRAELVARTLASLAGQVGAPAFEVVVVDDGSTDGTWDALNRLQTTLPFPLTPLRQSPNQGPAVARNKGWRAARGAVVCFTDDDCMPQPGWLAGLAGGIETSDIAQGETAPNPDQVERRGPFGRTMSVSFEQGFYETCNIAYRREVLDRAGGFDESFRYPFGEDTDLAWRARESGASSTFVPDALVWHDVWPSDYLAHLRDLRRLEGVVHVFSKHPQLRRHLKLGVFIRPTHPAAVAASAALLVLARRYRSPRRWAAAAVAGLWYAWICRAGRPKPPHRVQWAVVVPLGLVADLYEVVVLARASVRYRTLLL